MSSESFEQFARRTMSGEARGVGASLLRGALALAEPFYAGAMRARNRMYEAGAFRPRRLPRPVISVGNITTGGTGKTPVVAWLARRLCDAGHRPAVLLRGYRGEHDRPSDETTLLRQMLDAGASAAAIPVEANPDRFAGGTSVLKAS